MSKKRTPREYKHAIQVCIIEKEAAEAEIQRILEEAVPEAHFLTHKVSTFWVCEASPVGWCVWQLEDKNGNGLHHSDWYCHYCGDPVTRK